VTLTHGSLFTGYGGLDLAVEEVFDAETIWTSDVDPGANRIIAHRYPGIPNLGDITTIDWSGVRRPDILSGGSPCQDLSTAGARAGMVDGTRSNLWVAMREAIAQLEPTYVVWENVRGALSARAESDLGWTEGLLDGRPPEAHPKKEDPALRALGRVLGDLSDLGYDARWLTLRASDVGACHRRERVFITAHPKGHPWRQLDGDPRPAALTTPRRLLPTPTANLGRNGGGQDAEKRRAGGHAVSIEDVAISLPKLLPTPRTSDTNGLAKYGHLDHFGEYGEAIARHERTFGRAAPSPTEPGRGGNPRLAARFAEWMMCLPDGWVTDPAIWEGMTDTAARNAELHALGNGVVPPQAVAALRRLTSERRMLD
jgi:DNA (cytosine-5)-methyltransferase 1